MTEHMTIGPKDVATVAPPPAPKKPTPSVLHQADSVPREAMIVWGPFVDGDQPRECVPTSVVVTWQNAAREITGESHYTRGSGVLAKPSAANLSEAGAKLAAAKSLEDVLVVFTEVLAAGVQS